MTRENPFAEPDLPSRRFPPRDLTCRYLRNRPTCYNMSMVLPVAKLPCFAPPQSFLKRFALRWWQLKCRFAASSAPKLHIFHPPTRFAIAFTIACKHCYTGNNLMLASSNCPVLNPWAKVDVQTALVLLGAYFRPRIRRRALRAPSLDPRIFPNVALRAVRLPLVELGLIVRMWSARQRVLQARCGEENQLSLHLPLSALGLECFWAD